MAEKEVRHSVCALDCPDTCSLLINVENGQGSRLRGNPDHAVTRGFLCGKVARYLNRQYSPQRLVHPQKRIGAKGEGRFKQISWDQALDEIASRLQQTSRDFGPESILPYSYAGTMGLLQGSGMDRRLFHRLGASRLDRTICAAAGSAGLTQTLGYRYGTEPEQFRNSKLIIAWGANILGTNVHLWPFIVEARRNGAKLYVIDPVKNRTGELADKFFAINPGSDLALALGLMHVIFREGLEDKEYLTQHTSGSASLRELSASYTPERVAHWTGINAAEIVSLAREYATVRPAAIRLNYGVQRSERGGTAVRAIAMLPAIAGSWKEVGGGLQLSTSQAFQFDRQSLEMPELQKTSPLGRQARLVNMSELGAALISLNDPPVKALVVYNSNPAAIAPNQTKVHAGLKREDLFTVVLEQFQTDTADFADILLPVTTFLEHTDLYLAYGHYHLQLARPALTRPDEVRSNTEIFRAIGKRLGFTEPCFEESEDDMIRRLLASGHPFLAGITIEDLDRQHSIRLKVSGDGKPFLPFAEGGFGTPDYKANLDATGLAYVPPMESRFGDQHMLTQFPLEMITPKNDDSMNSTFGNQLDQDSQTATLWMHEKDASTRRIKTGDWVRAYNGRGSLRLQAHVDGKVSPGVVMSPSVRWPKLAGDSKNTNTLTSERLTDIGGGPTFYSCLVQVEGCGD